MANDGVYQSVKIFSRYTFEKEHEKEYGTFRKGGGHIKANFFELQGSFFACEDNGCYFDLRRHSNGRWKNVKFDKEFPLNKELREAYGLASEILWQELSMLNKLYKR